MSLRSGSAYRPVVSTQQQFNPLDYYLLSMAAASIGAIHVIREYCQPLPLRRRLVVAVKAKVLG